ncbi:MAG: hypothetical protein FWE06_00940 [Oscillospiraceae bacterium]|nr:hypothetical protein [Oscillospiraceae bacterium]
MTDKQELERRLMSHKNGAAALSKTDVGNFFGQGKDWTNSFLHGLAFLSLGRQKLYLATDIAGRWMELRTISQPNH